MNLHQETQIINLAGIFNHHFKPFQVFKCFYLVWSEVGILLLISQCEGNIFDFSANRKDAHKQVIQIQLRLNHKEALKLGEVGNLRHKFCAADPIAAGEVETFQPCCNNCRHETIQLLNEISLGEVVG